jgi:acyl-CoA reductase-like NAD-dependent aldehyde dehydrogenase
MANDTAFRLACYFCTRDLGRTFRVAEALEDGMVGVNEGIITTEVAPLGGVKESGVGREGSYQGIEGLPERQVHLRRRAGRLRATRAASEPKPLLIWASVATDLAHCRYTMRRARRMIACPYCGP